MDFLLESGRRTFLSFHCLVLSGRVWNFPLFFFFFLFQSVSKGWRLPHFYSPFLLKYFPFEDFFLNPSIHFKSLPYVSALISYDSFFFITVIFKCENLGLSLSGSDFIALSSLLSSIQFSQIAVLQRLGAET